MLYFDHCASTPPHEDVVRTMMEVMTKHYANPSSLHSGGVAAAKLIEKAREQLTSLMHTKQGKWLFTSGGTESNNLAIKGVARQYANRGKHIITSAIEHASVHEAMQQLGQEGFTITELPVDATGHVSVDQLKQQITDDTILVSVMHVNNELGSEQPIAQIGQLLKQYPKIIFHVDAVQSVGKLHIDIEDWGIDLLSASAHKLRGPRGVGFLYIRNGIQLAPLQVGGSQEYNLRAGTENVAAMVASAKALRLAIESLEQHYNEASVLATYLRERIELIPELKLNGGAPQSPYIVHFSYPGMKPEVVIHMLEQRNILASTRSACSSKDDKPSRVLMAIGATRGEATGGIRISFGQEHTTAHIDTLIDALHEIIQSLKHLERGNTH
ncbi:MAG TPA: cysteine desulfurase [Candidatus Paenibacillus intestinavium]|nr:cysteine desulfurase [Candidatus Paenibacillus intestinavium]